jgi:hypothetical protein
MHGYGPAIALTAANAAFCAFLATSSLAPPAIAELPPAAIRASAIELVDAAGRVRSRLGVEVDGEVVLRLFDESGRIRVKLGASDDGSGLLLLDETTEPGVQVLARRAPAGNRPFTTSLTLTGSAGSRRLTP